LRWAEAAGGDEVVLEGEGGSRGGGEEARAAAVVVDGREQRGRGAEQREEVVSEVQHRGRGGARGGRRGESALGGWRYYPGLEALDARVGWAWAVPRAYWASSSSTRETGGESRRQRGRPSGNPGPWRRAFFFSAW